MAGDESMQDAARIPGDGTAESARSGVWATAKKVAKKVRQNRPAKKTATTARPTAKKAGRATRRTEESAAPSPGAESTKTAAASAGAAGTRSRSAPARRGEAAAQATPASAQATPASAQATPASAQATPASAQATPASGSAASAADRTTAAQSGQAAGQPPSSIDAPRPPAPMHPAAAMDAAQEHAGGLGGMLALWGPLIMVGFLVLVFRGSDEREGETAAGADASMHAAEARAMQPDGAAGSISEFRTNGQGSGGAATAYGAGEGLDRVAYSRARSMDPSVFRGPDITSRDPRALMAANSQQGAYPPPPGPYRNPWTPGPPEGESPVQWVRCARPYYWCPAPPRPSW